MKGLPLSMSHIADLYNNGRCGQLRTVENARGAYADLIRKESRASDAAKRRRILAMMMIKCPRCALQVTSARCGNCCYYPIKMPTNEEIDRFEEMTSSTDANNIGSGVAARRLTTAEATKSSSHPSVGADCVRNARPHSSAVATDEKASDRLARLEKLVAVEREERRLMLERVKKLTAMVESYGTKIR